MYVFPELSAFLNLSLEVRQESAGRVCAAFFAPWKTTTVGLFFAFFSRKILDSSKTSSSAFNDRERKEDFFSPSCW